MKNISFISVCRIAVTGVMCAFVCAAILSSCSPAAEKNTVKPLAVVRYPGTQPGPAIASAGKGVFSLSNAVIAASWDYAEKQFTRRALRNCVTGQTVPVGKDLFVILLNGREPVCSSDLLLKGRPDIQPLLPDPTAACLDQQLGGMQISIQLAAPDNSLEVSWRALLRNGANYIRREVTVTALKEPVPLKTIVMMNSTIPGSRPGGDVLGSLMVTDTMFFGYEHPMADNNNGTELCFVSKWAEADVPFPARDTMDWNVSKIITSATEYQPQIVQHTGTNRLHIFGVALLEGEKEVTRDEHFGFTGSDKDSNNFYSIKLKTYDSEASYTLRAFTLGNGGSDSRGEVKMKRISTAPLVYCAYTRDMPVMPGESYSGSFVTGVVPVGQMRRGVLCYIERHRVHPYRTFLHYNSWYDIGYFTKYNEKDCLDVINMYGQELTEKRGVKIDSFLFDDGWDEPASLWNMHTGFPKGFLPLKDAAAKYDAGPGAWLSPWGGYHGPKKKRVKFGVAQGFETNAHGFALSGPNYFKRFSDTCLNMVKQYGVNQFKFDGVGRSAGGAGGNRDFEAAIKLINMLRQEKKDIYINLTTGTWPSPFWLQYADSIWRGGYDHQFAGVGTKRQQWITYRDGDTYERIVSKAPLFPLNSLMLHGIIYARHASGLTNATSTDLKAEIRSGFGTGTQLQELYITPGFLTSADWDSLAEAAKWARTNADILVDTHWVGGDPKKLEVYGWAAWSPRGATLVLRNPSDKAQQIEIEATKVFELPDGAARHYDLKSPFADQRIKEAALDAGTGHTFSLEPFEVLVFDTDGVRGVVE